MKTSGFLARTFAYRSLYVGAVLERVPRRAVLAVWSEVARLAFVLTACVLFSLVFWLLAAGALARDGWFAVWTVSSVACALGASVAAVTAAVGVVTALRDLDRVRAAVAEHTR